MSWHASPNPNVTPFIPPLHTPASAARTPPQPPPLGPPTNSPGNMPSWAAPQNTAQYPQVGGPYPVYPGTPYTGTPFIPQMSVHGTPAAPGAYLPPTGPAGGQPQHNPGVSGDYTGYPIIPPPVPYASPPGQTPWGQPAQLHPNTPWSAPAPPPQWSGGGQPNYAQFQGTPAPPGFGMQLPPTGGGGGWGPPPDQGGYTPAAGYGAPPAAYSAPPAAYSAPPAGYGAPPAGYGAQAYGGPPQGYGAPGGYSGVPPTPAGYGAPPSAAWGAPAAAGWGAQPMGGYQPAAPPPNAPRPGGLDRAMGHVGDRMDPFTAGDHYGPVLEPFLLRVVRAELRINPLLLPPPEDGSERKYLRWNMLFSSNYCQRGDGPPGSVVSWVDGRKEPATFPRVTTLQLISKTIPWMIVIKTRHPEIGVTCGEVIDGIDENLHKLVGAAEYSAAPPSKQRKLSDIYTKNRSVGDSVPGGRLGRAMRRLDWLCEYAMFGGIQVNDELVKQQCQAPLPCTVELKCILRYPMTEAERREQAELERHIEAQNAERHSRRARAESVAESDASSTTATVSGD